MKKSMSLAAVVVLSVLAFPSTDLAAEEIPEAAQVELDLIQDAFREEDWGAVLEHASKAAEIAPRNLEVQKRYISMHRFVTLQTMKHEKAERKQLALAAQYKREALRDPTNPLWPLLIGAALYYENPEESQSAYENALRLDPVNGEALSYLGLIATTRGDDEEARAYYLEAARAHPDDPQYLGSYVGSFMKEDFGRFRVEAMKLIERFPDSPEAIKWYYWLASKSPDAVEKRRYLQEAMDRYPLTTAAEEGRGSLGRVYQSYFELLQSDDPIAAEAFARETMHRFDAEDARRDWFARYRRQSDFNVARAARWAGDFETALETLGRLEKDLPDRDRMRAQVTYEKAQAQSGAGNHAPALETLAEILKEEADPVAEAAFFEIAGKAGKTEAEAEEQLWAMRLEGAEPFRDFTLPDADGRDVTLSDLRGQVVLVNFWYPSCGPCRGEFPYLQNIVQRFSGKPFKVLTLNTHPREADKVKPFMEKNDYGFVALQTSGEEWCEENYGVRGTPANFLIDQQGRVMAQPRLHSSETEERLTMLIEQLLNRGG